MTDTATSFSPDATAEATSSSSTLSGAAGDFLVAALYHFARFPRFESVRDSLFKLCQEQGVKGTLLLAAEGINGTIAGTDAGVQTVLSYLRAQPEFASLEHKESRASKMPFVRMKVKLKKEIVTMGVEDIDPNKVVGTYVAPGDWNALISDPDTIVIDLAMGRSEGLQIAQNLRRNPQYEQTMIIALASEDEANPEGLTEFGFSEAFKKPFDVALLGERIRTLVEEKRANL